MVPSAYIMHNFTKLAGLCMSELLDTLLFRVYIHEIYIYSENFTYYMGFLLCNDNSVGSIFLCAFRSPILLLGPISPIPIF